MINLLVTLNIMFCDIKGAVKNPGVYQIKENNIYEVINLAGGLKKDANITNINLSKKVVDEMVIYIPSIDDKPKLCPPCKLFEPKECPKPIITTNTTTRTTNITNEPTTTIKKTVNINTATKEELMTLNGIGEVVANKIIEYREETLFINIDELKNIKGIGEVIFAKIKDFITT